MTTPGTPAKTSAPRSTSRADRVRALLARKQPLVMGGFYDGVSARLVEKVGFPLAFMGGYAVAASLLGAPASRHRSARGSQRASSSKFTPTIVTKNSVL